jgi:hypothetical protein
LGGTAGTRGATSDDVPKCSPVTDRSLVSGFRFTRSNASDSMLRLVCMHCMACTPPEIHLHPLASPHTAWMSLSSQLDALLQSVHASTSGDGVAGRVSGRGSVRRGAAREGSARRGGGEVLWKEEEAEEGLGGEWEEEEEAEVARSVVDVGALRAGAGAWINVPSSIRAAFSYLLQSVGEERAARERLQARLERLEGSAAERASAEEAGGGARALERVSERVVELERAWGDVRSSVGELQRARESWAPRAWVEGLLEGKGDAGVLESVASQVGALRAGAGEAVPVLEKSVRGLEARMRAAEERAGALESGSAEAREVGAACRTEVAAMGRAFSEGSRATAAAVEQIGRVVEAHSAKLSILEEQARRAVDGERFEREVGDKAGREAVAQALHRKASRDELAAALSAIEERCEDLGARVRGAVEAAHTAQQMASDAREASQHATESGLLDGKAAVAALTLRVDAALRRVDTLAAHLQDRERRVGGGVGGGAATGVATFGVATFGVATTGVATTGVATTGVTTASGVGGGTATGVTTTGGTVATTSMSAVRAAVQEMVGDVRGLADRVDDAVRAASRAAERAEDALRSVQDERDIAQRHRRSMAEQLERIAAERREADLSKDAAASQDTDLAVRVRRIEQVIARSPPSSAPSPAAPTEVSSTLATRVDVLEAGAARTAAALAAVREACAAAAAQAAGAKAAVDALAQMHHALRTQVASPISFHPAGAHTPSPLPTPLPKSLAHTPADLAPSSARASHASAHSATHAATHAAPHSATVRFRDLPLDSPDSFRTAHTSRPRQ